ncbi:peptidoglycan -binding protein [Roseomonas indoligenes]|uniref:Peptidoglycan -binding protein n=1 Tax=Roseomonas indoligenes TaxID=2820811 RepID=A0A940MY71_9PROT|nr:peptidoglycan -binding protein [Pararoseomonas indoligenes]MBP0493367.1 peptidoglycan -binding protein [Pararoseomonas indoligenes]
MALGNPRRNRGEAINAWPGYVDALATLLIIIIFVLLVFVLAQGFLSVALSSRDRALDRLNRQVAELAELLSLERGGAEELRAALGRAQEEARTIGAERDAARRDLATLQGDAARTTSARDAAREERDRLAARLADAELAASGNGQRIASLEARLAEALSGVEAAGADTARTVRGLTETRRALATESAARQGAERTLAETRTALEAARRDLAAVRAEAERLGQQGVTDRGTIEARLADIARLNEQLRALAALREQAERQARDALARAGDEERRRQAAETATADATTARQAAEATAALATRAQGAAEARATEAATARRTAETALAEAARGRSAAETLLADAARTARAEAEARRAAEGQAGEYGRLAESARAQAALLTQQLDALRAELRRVASALDAQESQDREKDTQIAALGQRLNAALAARVEELQRYRSDFFGRLRDVLGDRPEIRIAGDRFVFQSEVLFPIGSAEMSDTGREQIANVTRLLLDIAGRIPEGTNWVLRVDGHADNSPVRPGARYASNWELSSARAIAVAQLMIQNGLPTNRVAATAFGEFQPIDTADTPAARARNRRIELRLTDR